MKLHSFLEASRAKLEVNPVIFNLAKKGDIKKILQCIRSRKINQVVDDYPEQLKELFQIENPRKLYAPDFNINFQKYLQKIEKKSPLWKQGRWVYFPWLGTLTHILEERHFFLVRTARNRNLITENEQKKFYDAVIGIAGLSVGNSVALAIVLQGGAKHIRLADHDVLALSNTNRIRTGMQALGLPKVVVTARQIYELNPYAKVELFSEGITPQNINRFFNGPPKLNLVIDELDNLAVKYLIREQAKRLKIAVLMGADNGDNAVIDIERFDKNPRLLFFHGRMGKVNYEHLSGLDKFGIGKNITKHIGAENVTVRMRKSLLEIGKTIVSWPQLGGAALINGSAIAYCARKIICGEGLEGNRALISLDEKLTPGFDSVPQKRKRLKSAKAFKKILGL